MGKWHEVGIRLTCAACGESYEPKDVAVTFGREFIAEREARADDS